MQATGAFTPTMSESIGRNPQSDAGILIEVVDRREDVKEPRFSQAIILQGLRDERAGPETGRCPDGYQGRGNSRSNSAILLAL
jgi:hypothetical protein